MDFTEEILQGQNREDAEDVLVQDVPGPVLGTKTVAGVLAGSAEAARNAVTSETLIVVCATTAIFSPDPSSPCEYSGPRLYAAWMACGEKQRRFTGVAFAHCACVGGVVDVLTWA